MKTKIFFTFLIACLLLASCAFFPKPPPPPGNGATAEYAPVSSNGTFKLTSADVIEGGALPKEFTCDGASATLPLAWSGAPVGTKSFAVAMHHIPGPGDTHWYWEVYNILADVTSLAKNVTGVGL